jgi:long-subunit fatty acid transport protein
MGRVAAKSELLIALVMALGLGAGRATWAQEEMAIDNFAGVGIRAMGMGGAFAAVADDFTAVFWNPAGLAQIEHREVYGAFSRNSIDNEADQAGNVAKSELSNTRIGSLGLVYPYPVYRGSLVFAAGFNRIKDFDSTIRIKGSDEAEGLNSDDSFVHEGELIATSLAVAMDVAPSISLGLAINLIRGEDENALEFTFEDVADRPQRFFQAQETFSDKFKSVANATLGAMIRFPREDPVFRVGATLSSGATHKIEYTFKGIPDVSGFNIVEYDNGTLERDVIIEDDGSVTPTSVEEISSSYKLELPLEFGIGLSGTPLPGLLLAGSAHFGEWSQTEFSGADESELRANASFESQYDNKVRYHLGAEWQIPAVAVDLRAGFYTDPLPFAGPRDPVREASEDNPIVVMARDRSFITLGAGVLLEDAVQVDVAWTHGTFERVEGRLKEENTSTRLFMGLSYRF